jgi:hypothetical protein
LDAAFDWRVSFFLQAHLDLDDMTRQPDWTTLAAPLLLSYRRSRVFKPQEKSWDVWHCWVGILLAPVCYCEKETNHEQHQLVKPSVYTRRKTAAAAATRPFIQPPAAAKQWLQRFSAASENVGRTTAGLSRRALVAPAVITNNNRLGFRVQPV